MSKEQTTILSVSGMTCGACVRHIETALRALDGVVDANVGLREGEARIAHDAERAPVSALLDAVRRAGYGATARDGAQPRVA